MQVTLGDTVVGFFLSVFHIGKGVGCLLDPGSRLICLIVFHLYHCGNTRVTRCYELCRDYFLPVH